MTISGLIALLERAKAELGDITVQVSDDHEGRSVIPYTLLEGCYPKGLRWDVSADGSVLTI